MSDDYDNTQEGHFVEPECESDKFKAVMAKRKKGGKKPEPKVTLSVPLIHTKSRSRKYEKQVTRGYYVNIPKSIAKKMNLREKELIEVTIKKLR